MYDTVLPNVCSISIAAMCDPNNMQIDTTNLSSCCTNVSFTLRKPIHLKMAWQSEMLPKTKLCTVKTKIRFIFMGKYIKHLRPIKDINLFHAPYCLIVLMLQINSFI